MTLLIYLVPVIIITLFMAKACNLLGLEDRTLTSLGVNVNVYRFGLSLLAVLLCSISVAVVGVIWLYWSASTSYFKIVSGN